MCRRLTYKSPCWQYTRAQEQQLKWAFSDILELLSGYSYRRRWRFIRFLIIPRDTLQNNLIPTSLITHTPHAGYSSPPQESRGNSPYCEYIEVEISSSFLLHFLLSPPSPLIKDSVLLRSCPQVSKVLVRPWPLELDAKKTPRSLW